MKLSDNFNETEAWKGGGRLSVGRNTVVIEEAEEGTSSGGHPEWEFVFSNPDGQIRDWLVVTDKTLGKLKQLTDAVGLDTSGLDELSDAMLIGKRLDIFVSQEPDRDNPSKMRLRVQSYNAPTAGSNGSDGGSDDDLPF